MTPPQPSRNPKLHRWTLCFTNSNHGELGSSDGDIRESAETVSQTGDLALIKQQLNEMKVAVK